ncbi:methyltransferase family protein [Roseibium hamelinense]|uniref:Methyltransferase family protein n=1 Tax=Roseibium hamelinense TaxID=150831 RepID=A0A562TBX2_9HYPH|nr:class I SAM-dependent methyltransferase [Roseibium hamelinense]MTI45207.1 class I SAM-dependent methyltransferase [Roseibium hamelinense]TWI90430.1 methyltransferase family protein [Roseibium hamelinense]
MTRTQYGSSSKLAARANLHSKYTITETPWFDWVAGQLPLEPDQAILDIGCGPGWFWASVPEFLPSGLALTLANQSSGMVEEALDNCQSAPFAKIEGRAAEVSAMPFEDGTFDGVLAMHMLYHASDPAKAIAECHRVLKPGGWFAATTNGAGNIKALYELARSVGGSGTEPVAAVFGFDHAHQLITRTFGTVRNHVHDARLRITDPEDVFLALTSFLPGETASEQQRKIFRTDLETAFAENGGVLEVGKQMGLFLGHKPV